MSLANKMCRLCMGRSNLTHTVLQDQLLQKIAICISLLINPEDHSLPLDICALCTLKVKDFFEFRQNCLEVQHLLRQPRLVESTEKLPEPVVIKQEVHAKISKFEVIVQNGDDDLVEEDLSNVGEVQNEDHQIDHAEDLEEIPEDAGEAEPAEVMMGLAVESDGNGEVPEEPPVSEIDEENYDEDMIEFLSYEDSIPEQAEDGDNLSEKATEIVTPVEPQNPVEAVEKVKKRRCPRVKFTRDEKEIYKALLIKCELCGKSVERNRFEGHQNRHANVRPYVCDEKPCEAAFHCKINLRLHKNGCHSTTEYPCDLCSKICPSRKTLYHHKKDAHGDKQFKCDLCSLSFVSNGRLKRHQVTHSEERQFHCPHCSKGFYRSNNLKVHLRSHTKEKPFECGFCNKAFGYQRLLRSHLQRKHGTEQNGAE